MSSRSRIDILEAEQAGARWIVTYADMMTLILVFFILLYTLNKYEEDSFRSLIETVQVLDGDGNQVSVIDFATKQGRNPEPLQVVEELLGLNPATHPIENIKPAMVSELESMIENTDLSDSVDLAFEGNQINLQIDGRFLFSSGRTELKDSAKIIFANLTVLFRQYADYKIAIQGHTDDLDIETVRFPSNWELSAVRATTVLRFFIQEGIDPERMTATGYADFFPLVNNDSPENRARNRRVEFVLEKEKEE